MFNRAQKLEGVILDEDELFDKQEQELAAKTALAEEESQASPNPLRVANFCTHVAVAILAQLMPRTASDERYAEAEDYLRRALAINLEQRRLSDETVKNIESLGNCLSTRNSAAHYFLAQATKVHPITPADQKQHRETITIRERASRERSAEIQELYKRSDALYGEIHGAKFNVTIVGDDLASQLAQALADS